MAFRHYNNIILLYCRHRVRFYKITNLTNIVCCSRRRRRRSVSPVVADRPTDSFHTDCATEIIILLRPFPASRPVVFRCLRWRLYYNNKPNTLACAGLVWRQRRRQKPSEGRDGRGYSSSCITTRL